MKMVSIYGLYRVPLDWFEVCVVSNEGEKGPKDIIHGYGTTYKMDDLLNMYPGGLNRMLTACAVVLKKDKQGYTFISKELCKN